jgi:DNA-binding NtrC family response regulator
MGKKILLVEDDQTWREMVAEALEDAGYEVVAVSGAAEAVLQKDEPDLCLVVLDLDLGGENGLMLMKHLKRQHPGIPVIIYTGMEPDPQAIARMREQGADQFLRKGPINELVSAVEKAAGNRPEA